jgi:hypothetical protein
MELHLKTPKELSARIRDLVPALQAQRVDALRVSRYRRAGIPTCWLAFLYVGGMRYDLTTQAIRHLPLANQADDLLRQLARFSPTTVEEQLADLVETLTHDQHVQFVEVGRLLSGLSTGAVFVFWKSAKGSLSGLTPLEALVDGRYQEVCRTAEGYAQS